jgi:hypothetical protein
MIIMSAKLIRFHLIMSAKLIRFHLILQLVVIPVDFVRIAIASLAQLV